MSDATSQTTTFAPPDECRTRLMCWQGGECQKWKLKCMEPSERRTVWQWIREATRFSESGSR